MEQKERIPKLTLVGAGPGDEELITVKAIKALADADVVLYDALVNEALLSYVPDRALRLFVGKRAGMHSAQQEEINSLIVKYTRSHGHVVRLKGGDPFVFGRGLEEMEVAQHHGIATAFVPGISSALAVPAMQHIPLTHRGVAESFWVVTGTTRSGRLTHDLHLAAQSSATIVILMGMKKLEEILNVFRDLNKHNTPVAIVQNGSRPDEKLGLGTVSTISEEAKILGLSSPAIIVIGEIVRHTKKDAFAHLLSEYIQ
ncbi:MAG: uroporphyrinogen-III C-methyltransferase [Cyclobacteriaceae bacterium]|nr:uroporphyrinogen-III C-methyltransferase [Cyclobacteriaceae bacterium]